MSVAPAEDEALDFLDQFQQISVDQVLEEAKKEHPEWALGKKRIKVLQNKLISRRLPARCPSPDASKKDIVGLAEEIQANGGKLDYEQECSLITMIRDKYQYQMDTHRLALPAEYIKQIMRFDKLSDTDRSNLQDNIRQKVCKHEQQFERTVLYRQGWKCSCDRPAGKLAWFIEFDVLNRPDFGMGKVLSLANIKMRAKVLPICGKECEEQGVASVCEWGKKAISNPQHPTCSFVGMEELSQIQREAKPLSPPSHRILLRR